MHLVFETYPPLAKADDTFSDTRWKMERQNRFVISEKFSEGTESPKQISKCAGIPLATVYRVVKNTRPLRGLERQEVSGCPRKLNETDRSRLGELVRSGKFRTLTLF